MLKEMMEHVVRLLLQIPLSLQKIPFISSKAPGNPFDFNFLGVFFGLSLMNMTHDNHVIHTENIYLHFTILNKMGDRIF